MLSYTVRHSKISTNFSVVCRSSAKENRASCVVPAERNGDGWHKMCIYAFHIFIFHGKTTALQHATAHLNIVLVYVEFVLAYNPYVEHIP